MTPTERLLALWDHLGIGTAHVATQMPGDIAGLAASNAAFDDPRDIDASKKQWARMLGILDSQFARTGGHVAGAAFTLADIPIGLSVNRWFMTPFERPTFAHVEAYYERLSARPAFLMHGRNGIA